MRLLPLLPLLPPLFLLACDAGPADDDSTPADDDTSPAQPEPLDLPEDPAAPGVPVGVTTAAWEGYTLEVWYPASDAAAGLPTEDADFNPYIPDEVAALVDGIALPLVPTGAVRDAPLRVPEAPYPVVLFSHGLGGTRIQSLDYAIHLASRGYVVAATDHWGRTMSDLLPCLFEPPLSGCDLTGMFGEDPALDDIDPLLDWVDAAAAEGFFAGALDTARIALSGHSAGGGVVEDQGSRAGRFSAYIGMATAPVVNEAVPTLLLGGTCDAFVEEAWLAESFGLAPDADLVQIAGAGHLAFADFCTLDLHAMADQYLAPRDDVNEFLLEQLVALAIDGCPGEVPPEGFADCPEAYLPLETSGPIIHHYTTAFLDAALLGRGPGVQPGVFPEARVEVEP